EDDIEKKKLTLLDVKDIEITMYRQIFYHKNKFKTKEMEKFTEFALEDN
ncbi:MAG: LysR family transcriptional regulator, partial [Limosilactobacillus fermentum]